jgi:hypothetical protein
MPPVLYSVESRERITLSSEINFETRTGTILRSGKLAIFIITSSVPLQKGPLRLFYTIYSRNGGRKRKSPKTDIQANSTEVPNKKLNADGSSEKPTQNGTTEEPPKPEDKTTEETPKENNDSYIEPPQEKELDLSKKAEPVENGNATETSSGESLQNGDDSPDNKETKDDSEASK